MEFAKNPHNPSINTLMKKVLLVTFQWDILCEIPKLFSKAGYEVHVLCPKGNCALANSYYNVWIDSGNTLQTLFQRLYQLSLSGNYTRIIFGDDPLMWQIYRQPLNELTHLLPIKNLEVLYMLGKTGFSEFLDRYNISTPSYYIVEQKSDILKAQEKIGFPLLIKPSYSNGGHGIIVCKDKMSYELAWSDKNFDTPWLVQKFVDGELLGVEALFRNGELIDYATSTKQGDEFTPSTKRFYLAKNPFLTNILKNFGKASKLDGFANMSYIKCSEDNYQLFEADPRPTAWVATGQWFGADFIKAIRIWLEDLPIPEINHEPFEENAIVVSETIPRHTSYLINQGRLVDALLHLTDFDHTWRYLLDDHVSLENRLRKLHEGIKKAIINK